VKIYSEASEQFRGSGSETDIEAFLARVHEKLGNEVRTSEPAYFANVSTRRTFVTLTYATDFERGKGQERFVWTIEGDRAVLTRYDINSRELVMK
jgi:hypothetical protein